MLLQIKCENGYRLSVCSNFLEHIYMYFRSSSQTKSPVGSSSGDRNGDGGRQTVGGQNKDIQTVSHTIQSVSQANKQLQSYFYNYNEST